MKKGLKIAGIIIVVSLALLIVLPISFKGKITEIAKEEINRNVNAEVDFKTIRISLLRNFPNVSLRLVGLSVAGVDKFEGVKLADAGSIFVSVDIMSIFKGDSYKVRSIRIDDPSLNIRVLKDGTANWDIMIPPEEIPDVKEEQKDTEPFEFNMALQNFELRRADIIYDDAAMDVYVEIINLNHKLRGDFTADFAILDILYTTAESLTFSFEGIPFILRAVFNFRALIDADFTQQHFVFRENELSLNDLSIGFDGYFAMPAGSDMDIDLTFYSRRTDIRSLISMIPAIYAKDFENIRTSGVFVLNGHLKGSLGEDIIPGFGLNILLEDGEFSYPDRPGAVTDMHIIAQVVNEGHDIDQTVVDISRFSLNMADNPVYARFSLKTPVSDPQFDIALNCDVDLFAIKDIYPLPPEESIKGTVKGDVVARGKLSLLEQQRYDELEVKGLLEFKNIEYASSDLDEIIELNEVVFDFSPHYIELSSMDCRFGETHVLANGRIHNIFGYIFGDQLLSGMFDFRANYIDINRFMAEVPEQPKPEEAEPVKMSLIQVPENIDFTLKSQIDKILLGNLDVTNIIGTIRVVDRQARMENLRMDLLGGSLNLNGSYATSGLDFADVNFLLAIENFDIQQTFKTFNTVQTLAPIGRYSHGHFSAGLNLKSVFDHELMPVIETLEGAGNISSPGIRIEDPPAMQKLADGLRMDKLNRMELRDFRASFSFKEGKIMFDPFDINFGKSSATVEGETHFDKTIDYGIRFRIPREEFGAQANQVLDGLVSQASAVGFRVDLGDEVKIDARITGTYADPEVSFKLSDKMWTARDAVREQIKDKAEELIREAREEVKEAIDETKEQVHEELEKRVQHVLSEARRNADRVRSESKRAAQRVRDEARQQAEKLEKEASGTIAKAAARRTGQSLISEADKKAEQIEKEGERSAQKIIDEANERAERIRAGKE